MWSSKSVKEHTSEPLSNNKLYQQIINYLLDKTEIVSNYPARAAGQGLL